MVLNPNTKFEVGKFDMELRISNYGRRGLMICWHNNKILPFKVVKTQILNSLTN